MTTYYELNMDGLVGPSHHYAGLSEGNIASTSNALTVANPMSAALQGLEKMRTLHRLGIKQAVMPPHQRPNLKLLHQLGFKGTPVAQITLASRDAPELLSACYCAASMWTANMATVSSSRDTHNKKVHFTAANLVSNVHRSQEADFSQHLLQRLFHNSRYFEHHPPLPKTNTLSDEGAANHSRLCRRHEDVGVHLFVYGRQSLPANIQRPAPIRYPARQTLEASRAVARNHQLHPENLVFAQQNPNAIDGGVFHNDVIAVANESVLLLHENAFLDQAGVLQTLCNKAPFTKIIEVSNQRVSLEDAVGSYLFNSQLLSLPDGNMVLIAPMECQQHQGIKDLVDELIMDDSNPITQAYYLDLKQSMLNGGGPACLRLRIPLSDAECQAMHQGVMVTEPLLETLMAWVKRHYRNRLHAHDLHDPMLINECFQALDELTSLLTLGSIYPFQH